MVKLLFVNSDVVFLGRDRNGSEYYFYKHEPHRIYVNFKSYFLATEH